MKLEIPECFFAEEEREGFLITAEVKRCWAAEMKLLLQVGEVLDRHGLRWYADCGTLLGAVRHRGFVPWDDDIDIIMPRADYQRAWGFLRMELPAYFCFHCSQFDNTYVEPWGGVVNRRQADHGQSEEEARISAEYFGFGYPIELDIFPLDTVPAVREEQEIYRTLYLKLYEVLYLYDHWNQWGLLPQIAQMMEEISGMPMPREPDALRSALWNLNDALGAAYSREDAGGADIMYYWANTGRTPRPVAAYDHTVMLPFEMIEVPAPAGYREILRVSYGDNWLTPVRGGSAHSYPYFAMSGDVTGT